jgi:hypothetical protein
MDFISTMKESIVDLCEDQTEGELVNLIACLGISWREHGETNDL